METKHGWRWAAMVAALLSVAAALAQPAVDVPTLVKGLQQRRVYFASVAGRVVIGRKALRADKPEPQPSLTVVDFAHVGDAYRIEQREVIVPTLRWYLCYGALNRERNTEKPIEPRHLYSSLVCDGKATFRFDQSMNTCDIAPVKDPARAAAMSDAQGFGEGIGSSATRAFGDMVGDQTERRILDGTWPAVIQGVDEIEGHDCYRVYADTGWKTGEDGGRWRTHYRLWVAPDLDYGAVRSEKVERTEKHGLVSCIVQRARGWAKDEQMDLWVPTSYQNDWFSWTGVKEMELPGPGWHQTLAVGRLALTNQPDAVAAALPLRYPFDC